MSADLAAYTAEPAGLEALDRQSVVALLERGKEWLTLAVERDTEIGDLVEFKGQAETVRVYTVQKQLGKDAELAAQELVRRAERGIGQAIRKGQEAGEIKTQADGGWQVRLHGSDETKKSAIEFFGSTAERRDAYAMADDATDEQFNSAVEEAKAEGNLSRANVVRKVTGRRIAPKRPEVLRGTRRIDSRRVIAATVGGYADNAIPQDLLAEVDFAELDTHDLREWISSLSESARALRSLRTTLEKELSQRV